MPSPNVPNPWARIIMSRYRPIAPKPPPPPLPPLAAAPNSSPAISSFDSLVCTMSPAPPTAALPSSRRATKRQRPSSSAAAHAAHERPSKRAAAAAADLNSMAGEKHLRTNSLSGALQQQSNGAALRPSCSSSSSSSLRASSSQYMRRVELANLLNLDDAGFLERAAVSASLNSMLSSDSRESCSPLKGDTSCVLRQDTNAACAGMFHWENRMMIRGSLVEEKAMSKSLGKSCPIATERREHEEEEEEEAAAGKDSRPSLVTLNLLPDTPSRGGSPLSASNTSPSPCSSSSSNFFSHYIDINEPCLPPFPQLQLLYGTSSEPVVLLQNPSFQPLWFNAAFQMACSLINAAKPYVDQPGIPIELGTFILHLGGPELHPPVSATLWRFAKEIAWLPIPMDQGANSAVSPSSQGGTVCTSSVVMPQPIRLVVPTIRLESITAVHATNDRLPSEESMEHLMQHLEGTPSLPAFITTGPNKLVRWVNTAFGQMLGQPQCPWIVSPVMKDDDNVGSNSYNCSILFTQNFLLLCNVEIPTSAPAFSGRVNIQWNCHAGTEKKSMTVPCDVTRGAVPTALGPVEMLVWRCGR